MEQSPSVTKIVVGWGIPIVLVLALGIAFQPAVQFPWNPPAEHHRQVERFTRALETIDESYAEPVDREELVRSAIQGMIEDLDQHSDYFPPEDYKRFLEGIAGQYTGVGMKVEQDSDTGYIRVVAPFPGGPAWEEGIRPGDLIVSVKGQSTSELGMARSIELIRGKPNTTVTLGVRSGEEEREVTLTRRTIEEPTVPLWTLIEPEQTDQKVGYVVIRSFNRLTPNDLREALRQLIDAGATSLIIDLRQNLGGLLNPTHKMADMFLAPGETVVRIQKRGGQQEVRGASSEPVWTDGDIVILVNEQTASASEVFAGALRDHGRARLVGVTTLGKDTVQRTLELQPGTPGTDAIQITVWRYLLPGGDAIGPPLRPDPDQEIDNGEYGIVPDVQVEMGETQEERRERLAGLSDAWSRGAGTPAEEKIHLEVPMDPQLRKAIDLLTESGN